MILLVNAFDRALIALLGGVLRVCTKGNTAGERVSASATKQPLIDDLVPKVNHEPCVHELLSITSVPTAVRQSACLPAR